VGQKLETGIRSDSVANKVETLSKYPGYTATLENGVVTVDTPIETGFSCQECDLMYLLLCEVQRSDELADEVQRLRAELEKAK
jgi:transcription initiation factor IIE alpha subunit